MISASPFFPTVPAQSTYDRKSQTPRQGSLKRAVYSAVLWWAKYRATIASWFAQFFEKPLLKRVIALGDIMLAGGIPQI
jgi:hypothetical protein